jgi:hypothetical protein
MHALVQKLFDESLQHFEVMKLVPGVMTLEQK